MRRCPRMRRATMLGRPWIRARRITRYLVPSGGGIRMVVVSMRGGRGLGGGGVGGGRIAGFRVPGGGGMGVVVVPVGVVGRGGSRGWGGGRGTRLFGGGGGTAAQPIVLKHPATTGSPMEASRAS